MLELAHQARGQLAEGDSRRAGTVKAAELLGQLLLNDVVRKEDGAVIKKEQAGIVSPQFTTLRYAMVTRAVVHFDGHKAAVAVVIPAHGLLPRRMCCLEMPGIAPSTNCGRAISSRS